MSVVTCHSQELLALSTPPLREDDQKLRLRRVRMTGSSASAGRGQPEAPPLEPSWPLAHEPLPLADCDKPRPQ